VFGDETKPYIPHNMHQSCDRQQPRTRRWRESFVMSNYKYTHTNKQTKTHTHTV